MTMARRCRFLPSLLGFRSFAGLASGLSADASPVYLKKFHDDGYVILRNVIDESLQREVQAHVEWILHKYPEFPPEHLHHPILRTDPFWMRLCSDQRLVDIATNFIGPNVALFSSHYFCKMPFAGKKVLWHQDGSYWPLEPMKVVSFWLAVDESTVHNGCLRVVRGSHKEDLKETHTKASVLLAVTDLFSQELQPNKEGENVLGSMTHDEVKEDDIVNIELNPGDVEIHHPTIIHGSEPNDSNRRRCGLTIRYISSSTGVTDPKHPVYMIRGEEMLGVNNYRSWPPYRPSYHMPFQGCNLWNEKRRIVEADETYFDQLTVEKLEKDVRHEVFKVVESLRS
eukprot:m.28008 g.28008  ORF g.28008 m.28008 type:complete len:340 (+) comp30527_c0_seq4:104-1123(+)